MIAVLIMWSMVGIILWFFMILIAQENSLTGAVGMSEGFEFVNPLFVYKHNKVNWFGALIIALFYSALCPIGAICYWLYKICTIGRKANGQ
jgi:hypothetical protein